jgi:uncharacterized Zn-binding protein involved in type VI secretion
MPGTLLHVGATVVCSHTGSAQPVASNPRVKVSGQPIVTQLHSYTIAGCGLAAIPSPPCATAQWITAATRIRANGIPVLLQDSQSLCAPTGTPLAIVVTQLRVRGI